MYAVRDHDMFSYIKSHPEDFPEKDKKTYREVFEEFHPVRWSLQNACSGFIDNQLFLYFVELFLWHLKFMLIS